MARRGGSRRPTYRELHRRQRHREFLDEAWHVVHHAGVDGLTMAAVTTQLATSVGGIYLYFPSRGHLLAELEGEALEALHRSSVLGQSHLEEVLRAQRVHRTTAALARVVAMARFWSEAEATHPVEVDLARRLLIDPGVALDRAMSPKVLPGLLALLDDGRRRLDEAAELGALGGGDGRERSAALVAAVNGALVATNVQRWDVELFDGHRLAAGVARSMLQGWGAAPKRLAAADALVDAVAGVGSLAPPVGGVVAGVDGGDGG